MKHYKKHSISLKTYQLVIAKFGNPYVRTFRWCSLSFHMRIRAATWLTCSVHGLSCWRRCEKADLRRRQREIPFLKRARSECQIEWTSKVVTCLRTEKISSNFTAADCFEKLFAK